MLIIGLLESKSMKAKLKAKSVKESQIRQQNPNQSTKAKSIKENQIRQQHPKSVKESPISQ